MIFRYPEMEEAYHAAPAPLQVVFRHMENILLEHGIEPIIYKILIGGSGPESFVKRRLEIQCGPFLYSQKLIQSLMESMREKYTMELLIVYRKAHDKIPERIIIEIPHAWAEQPKVFLKRFGYIKGGNHV